MKPRGEEEVKRGRFDDRALRFRLPRAGTLRGHPAKTIHVHLGTIPRGGGLENLNYIDRLGDHADRSDDVEAAAGASHADMQGAIRSIDETTKRKNGVAVVTGVVELSAELTADERRQVAADLAAELSARGHLARVVIHRPDRDAKTWHVHWEATARPVRRVGGGWVAAPEGTRGCPGPAPLIGGKAGVRHWRSRAAELQNRQLEVRIGTTLATAGRLPEIGVDRPGLKRIPEAVMKGAKKPDAWARYVLAWNASVLDGRDPRLDYQVRREAAELARRRAGRDEAREKERQEAAEAREREQEHRGWVRTERAHAHALEARKEGEKAAAREIRELGEPARRYAEDVWSRTGGGALAPDWWRRPSEAAEVWRHVRQAEADRQARAEEAKSRAEAAEARADELEKRYESGPPALVEAWRRAAAEIAGFDPAAYDQAHRATVETPLETPSADEIFDAGRRQAAGELDSARFHLNGQRHQHASGWADEADLEEARSRVWAAEARARDFGVERQGILKGRDDAVGRTWAADEARRRQEAATDQVARKQAAAEVLDRFRGLHAAEAAARAALLENTEARRLAIAAGLKISGLGGKGDPQQKSRPDPTPPHPGGKRGGKSR
ncbi:MAG: hypothetical protein HQL41_04320 [Alphaproteobacteria bacterium]|nr:hypothetical protein [Alphaproteobacteria bacterium]